MLTHATPDRLVTANDDDAWFTEWRSRELSRIARSGMTYLDYTGSALYPESLVRGDAARLAQVVLGNPHSESRPSRAATGDVESARRAILAFLHADPDEYVAVLTSNASAACRLVGESFPYERGSVLAVTLDNHNSVNGLGEFARARGASLAVIGLDDDLRLQAPRAVLDDASESTSLLALPAQSNFSGVRHPLELVKLARDRGWRVLLDAASYLPSADLRLDEVRPDFVALSLYKIAGYPTGLGALVARREALAELRRPWFAGGTVQWVSVQNRRHQLGPGPEAFEDGTLPFLAAGAVPAALAAVRDAGRERLARHLACLTSELLGGLRTLAHANGAELIRVHGPLDPNARGASVAFSLHDRAGETIPYWEVEEAARVDGIAVRGGCFCNPGCAEAAFGFPSAETRECLERLGDDFTIPRFAACLGDRTVGAIRISLGLGSIRADVQRALAFLRRYLDAEQPVRQRDRAA